MVDGLTDGRIELKASEDRSIVPGLVAVVLGLLALAIAAVEYFVFSEITASTGGGNQALGFSFGTMAYFAGYVGAGIILIAIGILKIRRA